MAAQIEARPVVATLGISGVIVATCDLDHWGIHIDIQLENLMKYVFKIPI